jgi:hypothetical protein
MKAMLWIVAGTAILWLGARPAAAAPPDGIVMKGRP